MNEIKTFPDPVRLAEAAAEHFVGLAEEAVAAHGQFTVALAGGSTPRSMHALLATEPLESRVDWSRVHVFWLKGPLYRMDRESLHNL